MAEQGTETQETTTAAGNPAKPDGAAPERSASKVVHLTAEALQRRVRDEREKGRKAALAALDQKAKEQGFASHDDMISFIATLKNQKPTAPKAAPEREPVKAREPARETRSAGPSRREREEMARLERDRSRAMKAAEQAQAEIKKARREAYRLQRERDNLQAEMQLRTAATEVGIVGDDNLDVALLKLKKHAQGKTEKELDGFDEKKFFEGLRENSPYLFKEVTRPANTGVQPTGAPSAQRAPAATATGTGKPTSVADLSPEKLKEYLRLRGLDTDWSTRVSIPSLPSGGIRGGGAQA